ncbi:MAG: DUF5666 domain-containing protein [Sulfitobacter sp.]
MSVRSFISAVILLCLTCSAQAQEEEREGGIIGTGIVGTITHLGSIYVNGQHIQKDAELDVTGAIAPMNADDLRPGHVVAVSVRPEGADWRAQRIQQILPLVGPIEEIGNATVTVMGTRVQLDAQMAIPGLGEWVAVSGLWQGQLVKASRLDPVPEVLRRARISGTYFGPDSEARDVIGGTKIIGIEPEHLEPGDFVQVFGEPITGGIEAVQLERHLFEDSVSLIQVEGYFSRPQPSGLYTVLGSGLVAYTNQPEMIDLQKRVILCGGDGRLRMQATSLADAQVLRRMLTRLKCKF